MNEQIRHIAEIAVSPQTGIPLSVGPTVFVLFNYPLSQWLILFSSLYTITLFGYTAWKWYKEWKQHNKGIKE